jgi:(E)-4-hydroxy-3-methylbut-2-enyl-diphosphate synthase
VEFCHGQGFYDVVVSAKAHDVPTTVATYHLLSQRMPEVPLHIGVTEAGTLFQGLIKSASGLGILLEQGIGDTMRISLTDDPTEEVRACWTLLSALGLRRRDPELVSCPTCGRCQVDLIPIAQEVEKRLRDVHRPIQVAVMGCVVNGPGEAADADIGVACGKGSGVVFAHGKTLRKVEEAAIVDVLMEEIGNL